MLDDDPVTLINQTTTNFDIAPDKASLTRISTHLRALARTRESRIDARQDGVAALGRRLKHLDGCLTYEEGRHDAGRHAAEMLRMDTEKFRVAKCASEAEIEGERLGGELAALRQQLDTLEREGVEGGQRRAAPGAEAGEDEVVLKLQFFRSLGIDAVRDSTTGEYTRAVIRNPGRGDVNVVNLDGSLSPEYYTNMFWESL